jgi:hypothetical protein
MAKNDKAGIDKANEKRTFWRTLATVVGGVATVTLTIVSLGKFKAR